MSDLPTYSQRKKTGRTSRKKRMEEEIVIDPKIVLRKKLKDKLREKHLERTSRETRDAKLDNLEQRLKKAKTTAEKKKIQDEIDLLEKIDEREGYFCGEFPDYGDSGGYGGGCEHPD